MTLSSHTVLAMPHDSPLGLAPDPPQAPSPCRGVVVQGKPSLLTTDGNALTGHSHAATDTEVSTQNLPGPGPDWARLDLGPGKALGI